MNSIKKRKVVLVGCGFVGMSFIYSAINQFLFDEYVLIDVVEGNAKGNAIDVSDAIPSLPNYVYNVRYGDYSECSDADIVVITAGLNQKPGETRLDLVEKNAKIIKEIATNIKASGFDGISIIASNPIDILTTMYHKFTGYDANKVIGSGTTLDTARLTRLLAEKLEIGPETISAYVVGEHGDSSVSLFSSVTVGGIPLRTFAPKSKISDGFLRKTHKEVVNMAYKIIDYKKATYYGIGAVLANICRAVLKDANVIMPVSVVNKFSMDMFTGFPAIINASGCVRPVYPQWTKEEKNAFKKSCKEMKKVYLNALEHL